MTEKSEESFSGYFFKASIFVLILGVLFTLGEALSLNSYTYLNTFSYVDFLIKAVLISPFLVLVISLYSVLKYFIWIPVEGVIEVKKSTASNGRSSTEIKLSFLNAIAGLLISFLFPIFALITFVFAEELRNLYIGYAILLFIAVIMLIIDNKTKKYSVRKKNKKPFDNLMNKDNINNSYLGLLIICVLAFASGNIYIKVQKTDVPNAVLTLKSTSKEIKTRILASNSNVLATSNNNYLVIIPRDNVVSIRYLKELK